MSRPSALDVFRGPESTTGGGLGRGSTLALRISPPSPHTTLQTLQTQLNDVNASLTSLCKSVNQKADYLATNEALLRLAPKGDALELGRYIQREVVTRLETLGESQTKVTTRTASMEARLEVLEKLVTGQAKRIEELETELRGVKGAEGGSAEIRSLLSDCAKASSVAQLEEKCKELSSSIVTLARITDTAAEVHAKTVTATLDTVTAIRERMSTVEEYTGDLMVGLGIPPPQRDEKGRKPATASAAKSALQTAADTALKGKLYSMKIGLEALLSGAKERLSSELTAALTAGLAELKEEVGREVRRGRAMRVEMAQVISTHRQAPPSPIPPPPPTGAGDIPPLSQALQTAVQVQAEQVARATSSPVRHLALDVAKQVAELQEGMKEASLKVAATQGGLEERVSGLGDALAALRAHALEVLTPGLDRVTKAVGDLRGDLSSVLALKLSPPPPPPSTPPRQHQHQPPSNALMGLLASPPPMLEPRGGGGGGGGGGVIAGRWMWRRRGLHKDCIVSFDVEALNTDKGLLGWSGGGGEEGGGEEEGGESVSLEKRATIVAHRQGLYRVTTAFFAFPLPRISVLVNAQPACLLPTPCDGGEEVGGSGRGCVYSHDYGTVAGNCSTFFLSLPAKAVVQIGYEGTVGQGFLELSKL